MSALIFDCDGVLADTERYGHLPAFNAMFERLGIPAHWSEDDYADLLKVGGGKERMASAFDDPAVVEAAGSPSTAGEKAAVIAEWHKLKTEIFKELVESGKIPPRPGITRIITEAVAAHWTVAVASTSAEASVRAVLANAVGDEVSAKISVFAGDVVPRKKPDPAIYLLALDELGIDPATTLVVEDSNNGLRASTGAGLATLVTVNGYTEDEDFDDAALVVSALGDPGLDPIEVVLDPYGLSPLPYVTLGDIDSLIGAAHQPGGKP